MVTDNMQSDDADDHNMHDELDDSEDLSLKEQILLLIAALKDSALQELDYFKARTGYSINMIVKGSIFFFIAFIFVLAAFILVGVGLLLAFESIIGIVLATILSVVIFLTLSIVMALIGKSYFKKLTFPELNDVQLIAENNNDEL